MKACLTRPCLTYNNDMRNISSISWHHCMSLTRKLWGYLKKLKAQSDLTFRSADFPHLEGTGPANSETSLNLDRGLFDSQNIRSLKICQHQPGSCPAGEFNHTCVIKRKITSPECSSLVAASANSTQHLKKPPQTHLQYIQHRTGEWRII